ncbi:malic enzyme-like NAD(P)-binding protein [Streptomyces sp. NPDC012616]|uniref:malic enzyme-like NAD(P)-binding protein n=1 Tax=Streptomyces sp. NPDC012616 TaxID=3364840 RepID=UPI0036EFD955
MAGTRLADQRIVILGAGSAAVGVADMIRSALVDDGVPEKEAASRFWFVDVDGLLTCSRDGPTDEQRIYARDDEQESYGLAELVDRVEPTVLIGLSTVHGVFTEEIVRRMAASCDRPVIFLLSNPTSHAQADPACPGRPRRLVRWTDGKVLVATGSPFPPVTVGSREVPVVQANNVYVFPAIGLAVTASRRATRVTDRTTVAPPRPCCRHYGTCGTRSGRSRWPLRRRRCRTPSPRKPRRRSARGGRGRSMEPRVRTVTRCSRAGVRAARQGRGRSA